MTVSAIICGCNESDMEATILSALEDSGVTEIITVDDFSDRPFSTDIDDPRLKIVRTDQSLGVGGARNFGAGFATGDILTFHDAHMRFPDNCISRSAEIAFNNNSILCVTCNSIKGRPVGAGANLYWDDKRGFVLAWAKYERNNTTIDIPAVLGAHYVIPYTVWEKLGPWLDTVGRWGYSEEAISIKAHILGIPVQCACHLGSWHKFRSSREQPFPVDAKAKVRNQVKSLYCLFNEVYEKKCRPMLVKKLGEKEVRAIEEDPDTVIQKERAERDRVRSEDEIMEFARYNNVKFREDQAKKGIILSDPIQNQHLNKKTVRPAPITKVPEPVKHIEPVEKVNKSSNPGIITACIVNRDQNLTNRIISSLLEQTIESDIFVWDITNNFDHEKVKLCMYGPDMGGYSRWVMARNAKTPYLLILDSIVFNDPLVIHDAINKLRQLPTSTIIGPYGVKLLSGKSYKNSQHIKDVSQDTKVDIVKGSMMFMQYRNFLALELDANIDNCCDDIMVSLLALDKHSHIVADLFNGRVQEIQNTYSIPNHYERRDKAVKQLFNTEKRMKIVIEHRKQEKKKLPSKLNIHWGPENRVEDYLNYDVLQPKNQLYPDLPFKDNEFDQVLIKNVLVYLSPDELIQVMNELHRIIKPTGTVTIIVPSAEKNPSGAVCDPMQKTVWLPRTFDYWTAGTRYYSYGEKYGYEPWKRIELTHTSAILVIQQPIKDKANMPKFEPPKSKPKPAPVIKKRGRKAQIVRRSQPKQAANVLKPEQNIVAISEEYKIEDLLPITGLCCTYGRISLLARILTCFIEFDYPEDKKFLYILNDAEIPIESDIPNVKIFNLPKDKFPTLGHKRQFLLEQAETPLVAQIDDDDLYRPKHFLYGSIAFSAAQTGCIRQQYGYYAMVSGDNFRMRGIARYNFEGMLFSSREEALELGGYSYKDSGQALDLMNKFKEKGRFKYYVAPNRNWTYIYAYDRGVGHISHFKDKEKHSNANQDFGDGGILQPADISTERQIFVSYAKKEW